MLVYSHRGYHVDCDENTLEAFDRAAALGVDGIETDVRRSADGLPVMFHDRNTPDGRAVASLTHLELCRAVGFDVPTLPEVLQRGPETTWMLEIKSPDGVEPTIEAVQRFGQPGKIVVTSFWHTAVEAMRRRLDVPCGLLVAHRPLDPRSPSPDWPPERAKYSMVVWAYEVLADDAVRHVASRGLKNFVYDAVTPAEHRRCAELGIDGVISDEPKFGFAARAD